MRLGQRIWRVFTEADHELTTLLEYVTEAGLAQPIGWCGRDGPAAAAAHAAADRAHRDIQGGRVRDGGRRQPLLLPGHRRPPGHEAAAQARSGHLDVRRAARPAGCAGRAAPGTGQRRCEGRSRRHGGVRRRQCRCRCRCPAVAARRRRRPGLGRARPGPCSRSARRPRPPGRSRRCSRRCRSSGSPTRRSPTPTCSTSSWTPSVTTRRPGRCPASSARCGRRGCAGRPLAATPPPACTA